MDIFLVFKILSHLAHREINAHILLDSTKDI